MNKKFQKNLLLNWIIFFWIILFFLWWYIFYKIFFTWKIYKNISKNIDYFIEFDLKNFWKYKNFLWKNQPFFTSYLDQMNFKKWSIIFYKWEKIDTLLTWNEKNSINFLKKISTKKEVKKEWKFLISEYSPAPNCAQNWKNLFCAKNTKILKKFISDIQKWEILKNDKKFLKVENNLNIAWNFLFWYANLKNKNIFPLISEKFISWWFTFWEKNSEIKWIFYWNFEKKSWEIFYKEKKNIDLKKYFNSENTIFLAYSRDFSEKMKKYFKYYSEKNPQITEIWKNIFEEKKSDFKLFFERNYWWKIFFKNPKKDVFILSSLSSWATAKDPGSSNSINNFSLNIPILDSKWQSEKIYSDEKIFVNLEKIREIFWLNYLKDFNFLTAYSKNFDDWIQVKIQIK